MRWFSCNIRVILHRHCHGCKVAPLGTATSCQRTSPVSTWRSLHPCCLRPGPQLVTKVQVLQHIHSIMYIIEARELQQWPVHRFKYVHTIQKLHLSNSRRLTTVKYSSSSTQASPIAHSNPIHLASRYMPILQFKKPLDTAVLTFCLKF